MLMGEKNHLAGYFDAAARQAGDVEFVDRFEPTNSIRILPYGLRHAQTVDKIGADSYEGPGLAISARSRSKVRCTTVWPPASHRRIFGDLKQAPAPTQPARPRGGRLERAPGRRRAHPARLRPPGLSPAGDRRRRQAVSGAGRGQAGRVRSFEQAVRVGPGGRAGRAGLPVPATKSRARSTTSPWPAGCPISSGARCPTRSCSTWPSGSRLSQPDVLRGQVERMLETRRPAAFTENFVGQWLGLRDIDFTEPSQIFIRNIDDMLKVSMVRGDRAVLRRRCSRTT